MEQYNLAYDDLTKVVELKPEMADKLTFLINEIKAKLK